MESNIVTNEPIYRKKKIHGLGEQICSFQDGGGVTGMDLGFGVSRGKLMNLVWISNEVVLYSI